MTASLQQLTWLASAPFRAQHQLVSGRLSTGPASRRGGTGLLPALFPPPFSSRHSLLGHPFPPGVSAPLTIGLPPGDRLPPADHDGVSVFRTRETRPGPGALYTPGTAVPARARVRPMSAACRLAAAGPCHPGVTTRPGMSLSRGISKGSLALAPPGHSPRLWPPDGTGTLGLSPGLRTRLQPGPSRACRGGDRPQALAWNNAVAISDLLRRIHSSRATSRRNALTRCPLEPGTGSLDNFHHPSSEGTFHVNTPESAPLFDRWIEAKRRYG